MLSLRAFWVEGLTLMPGSVVLGLTARVPIVMTFTGRGNHTSDGPPKP